MEPSFEMDKLSYEIFSILENKFLFGYDDPKLFLSGAGVSPPETPAKTPARIPAGLTAGGKVRVLSIDGGARPVDGLLAAVCLARLEAALRCRSGDPGARIADFFDVAAGSGAGGVLAAMLFTRGGDGRPLFSAEEALNWWLQRAKNRSFSAKKGLFRGLFRRSSENGAFRRIFGDLTLKDTVKPVLIPCYDLATGAPFLFSRADAMETDGYDFLLREVCTATCTDGHARAAGMRSVDGRTAIAAVGGGVAMGNPSAAAVTHVLHNKQEFPFAAGVEDLLVVSLGRITGAGEAAVMETPAPSAAELVRIAGEGVADMVDQAVSMAFGQHRASNYVRIQGNGLRYGKSPLVKIPKTEDTKTLLEAADEILLQRNVESLLFQGKKISERTNAEMLEMFAGELLKEQERRKRSPLPTVIVKQVTTPRTSSATTSTISTTTTTASTGTSTSPSH